MFISILPVCVRAEEIVKVGTEDELRTALDGMQMIK